MAEMKSLINNKSDKKKYHPNEIRSHPFRFILLPIIGIAIFIFYWFALVPSIHFWLRNNHNIWLHQHLWIYWTSVFIIFLLLMVILVCIWRCCKSRKKDLFETKQHNATQGYKITFEQQKLYQQNNDLFIDELNENKIKIRKRPEALNISLKSDESEPFLDKDQRHSAYVTTPEKIKSFMDVQHFLINERRTETMNNSPKKLNAEKIITDSEKTHLIATKEITPIISGTKTETEQVDKRSTLTPREEFFKDLLFGANSSQASTRFVYDQTTSSTPLLTDDKKQNEESVREFFIANVAAKERLTSEAYITVSECCDNKLEIAPEWVLDTDKCELKVKADTSTNDENIENDVFE